MAIFSQGALHIGPLPSCYRGLGILVRGNRQVYKVAEGGAREEADRTISNQFLEGIDV